MMIKICSWNLNGIKKKFSNDNILSFLNNFNLLCISETHFGVRSKCPDGFTLIARSKKIESKAPRGGVAIFRNNSSYFDVDLLYDGFQDCVVCRVRNTEIVLVAFYIPPSTSIYYDERYFEALDLIYNMFRNYKLFIIGDLNCRVGTPSHDSIRYATNPDIGVNAHGAKLNNWIIGKDLLIMNGYTLDSKQFSSDFTFYRGKSRSQNDLVLSNAPDMIKSFTIKEKQIYSDHTPVSFVLSARPWCSIEFIQRCAKGVLSDDHLDINKRKVPSLNFNRIDWPQAIKDLEEKSPTINMSLQNPDMDNDHLEALITTTIYDVCRKNYKRVTKDIVIPPIHNNCTSRNFKAIAKMNFYT